jgi:RimJ/RimL family protein N-acetyltransferase
MAFTLSTPRLDLVLEGTSALEAFLRSRGELASILGVDVPPDWPVCGSAVIGYVIDWLREDPDIGGFGAYFIVHRADNRLIGDGGFKGRPNDRGEVEVGYAIIEAYRGQGYATEAAQAFVDWAFTHPDVNAVLAETFHDGLASQRVLCKVGMTFAREYFHPDDGKIFKWRLKRPAK